MTGTADNSYFEDKKGQVNEYALVAFGVDIESRHGKARELSELLAFADELAKNRCQHLVKKAFYDSNSCCCTFTFADEIDRFDIEAHIVLDAASRTISQFEWFGMIKHGEAKRDQDQDS